MATYTKDPAAILDYEINWSDWLGELTIETSTWTVPSDLSQVLDENTDTTALVRISGGTDRLNYEVTNHIVASNGMEDERSITISVRNQ